MDKKIFLAIALSLAAIITYKLFFAKPQVPPAQAPSTQAPPTQTAKPSQQTAQPAKAVAATPAPTQKTAVAKGPIAGSTKDIKVETAKYTAIFSTRGGALKSFQLKGYQKDCTECADDIYPHLKKLFTGKTEPLRSKSKDLIELVDIKEGVPYPLAITFPGSSVDIAPDSIYETAATKLDLTNTRGKRELVFSQTLDNIVKVEKIFTFNPLNYNISLDIKVHNLSDSPLNQIPKLSWQQYADPNLKEDNYGHDGPIASIAKHVERQSLKELDKEKIYSPNVLWGGYESKYFIASFIPQNPSLTSVIMNRDSNNMVSVSIEGPKEIIPARQNGSFSYTLYLGPKVYDLLKLHNVGLEDSIDFGGWLKVLAIPLLLSLNFIHNYIPNYGVAIILLTLLIKIIFWPLGNISYKSMQKIQTLQPQIAALKEKYKNDKNKLNQEKMGLYRAHGINPFGGCLPLLIQIPIFFGLYKVLLYSVELRHSPFFGWIQDLSACDPYYITPIIMGATQFIQQKTTPTLTDQAPAKMMMVMPVIFTFFFLSFPSGLVIYWLFNNIFSIVQQYHINKKLGR
jgi:YidC/Oxa1 family membrane protein insertase